MERNEAYNRGRLDTLAQNGTNKTEGISALVQGMGTDLTDTRAVRGRSKRKLITQTMMLKMVDFSKGSNDALKQSYWNTYHCQNKLYSDGKRLYGRYCKNRYCTLCSAIRKADIINRYLPVISSWKEPYFLTLTVKAVPYKRLRLVMQSMIGVLRKITAKYRKRGIRGKGYKLRGIRSLESNFNPKTRTYNPHFHILIPDRQTGELILQEWLSRAKRGWTVKYAQKLKPVDNTLKSLIEIVKYGSKIFTEPDLSKAGKVEGDVKVYVKALYNIFLAMRGLRIFERFGFNLPDQKKPVPGSRLVTGCTQWEYILPAQDWVSADGEKLSAYFPEGELLQILSNSLDIEIE